MSDNELMKKIEKIDLLLENDNEFDEYINKICSEDIAIPDNLNNKIMSKVNKKDSKVIKFTNILKIVACTVFTLIVWIEVINNENLDNRVNSIDMKIRSIDVTSISEKISNKMSALSDFFLAPLEIKRGDNK